MTGRNPHYQERRSETLTAADDLYNGVGSTTDEYNDTDGNANGETFLRSGLRNVDQVQVSVSANDGALSANNVGVQVSDARPATASDFNSASDYINGSISITLTDEDGTGEISDDTDISNLEFEVDAVGT